VNAWEWQAGNASGIHGERRTARRHAAAALRAGDAENAELQMITVVTDTPTLEDRHVPVNGTKMRGRRHGRGVRWRPDAVAA
jgi:hypothetical protein